MAKLLAILALFGIAHAQGIDALTINSSVGEWRVDVSQPSPSAVYRWVVYAGAMSKNCYGSGITQSCDQMATKTFEMNEGSCLRGPLKFFDLNGKVIFELAAKSFYPADCEKN